MPDVILHQYEMSPFSEKIRKVFAFKELAWASVDQPVVAPKPDLTPLTGGYRRIPVLQMGAHIYCDTALIVKVLDEKFPEKLLTPPALSGVAEMIVDWADHRVFMNATTPAISEVMESLPDGFLQDRAAMGGTFGNRNMDMETVMPHMCAQVMQACYFADSQLAHSAFLLGAQFTVADAAFYHVINFACTSSLLRAQIEALRHVHPWRTRITNMGQGQRTQMSTGEALNICRTSAVDHTPPADAANEADFPAGTKITVQADDYGQETTSGEIVWTRRNEIAILREDATVGEVMVHYPRAGYLLSVNG